ncbi:hypothetical protein MESS2_120019 [Mesorhizobium metallidurans STM 2683]|uniref:Uncharacterized protein n=1 Tax=Mesorhizobium metallidurans STM 2683 TaxID=1297569 RepID=M5EWQ5_9HYPH|nr:hypothetical protein MESS2_120019 [Mesorhizobium metallidurans STM 2683]
MAAGPTNGGSPDLEGASAPQRQAGDTVTLSSSQRLKEQGNQRFLVAKRNQTTTHRRIAQHCSSYS